MGRPLIRRALLWLRPTWSEAILTVVVVAIAGWVADSFVWQMIWVVLLALAFSFARGFARGMRS